MWEIKSRLEQRSRATPGAVSEGLTLVHHQTYVSREEAKQSIFEYLEVFYNRERLHSANGYQSPVDFELQHKAVKPCVRKSVDISLLGKNLKMAKL